MVKNIVLILAFFSSLNSAQQVIKEYYPNGNVKSEITFSDSIRNGEARFYYENGNIKEERNYVNGRVDGLVKYYNEDGIIQEMIYLENGKREGPSTVFDEKGDYLKDIYFAEGKRIVEEEPVITETQVAANDQKETEEAASIKREPKKNNSSLPLPPVIEEENPEEDPAFYLTAEVMPEPVDGWDSLYNKIVFPAYAKEKGIVGTVKVLTFIDNHGDVLKAEVIEGLGYGLDETARYAIYYTRFKPGLIRGKPVKVQMTIPVEFKIDGKK